MENEVQLMNNCVEYVAYLEKALLWKMCIGMIVFIGLGIFLYHMIKVMKDI